MLAWQGHHQHWSLVMNGLVTSLLGMHRRGSCIHIPNAYKRVSSPNSMFTFWVTMAENISLVMTCLIHTCWVSGLLNLILVKLSFLLTQIINNPLVVLGILKLTIALASWHLGLPIHLVDEALYAKRGQGVKSIKLHKHLFSGYIKCSLPKVTGLGNTHHEYPRVASS